MLLDVKKNEILAMVSKPAVQVKDESLYKTTLENQMLTPHFPGSVLKQSLRRQRLIRMKMFLIAYLIVIKIYMVKITHKLGWGHLVLKRALLEAVTGHFQS